MMQPVLVGGELRASDSAGEVFSENPATRTRLDPTYPVSSSEEVEEAIRHGVQAANLLDEAEDVDVATFLELYATAISVHAQELAEMANQETGLPISPRLKDVELIRTVDQLRQAAETARTGVWRRIRRDGAKKLVSAYAPLGGPVVVIGPNNFPFAYNGVSGGDFASAIVARSPVIAKANPGHLGTSLLLARLAFEAVVKAGLPASTVQMLYHVQPDVGLKMVSDPRVAATAFTGSKRAGLALKAAADRTGRPIYLEMGSINPVVLLEGALDDRWRDIAQEFFASCTMAAGQFCTNPGFIVVPEGRAGDCFVDDAVSKFSSAQPGVLLGRGVLENLASSVETLIGAGATLLCGGSKAEGSGYRFDSTILSVSGAVFLAEPKKLQTEAFGPVALFVRTRTLNEMASVIEHLDGNLTGTIYSGVGDESRYAVVEKALRRKVGRLNNDKMPTGVAVSPAMNHGGPYPATGHPGFTAVGFPACVDRFTALHCYDSVPNERLPRWLRS